MIAEKVLDIEKGLTDIVRKNSQFVTAQLRYLNKKVDESVINKHQVLLRKFDQIEASLHPYGSYQERYWNICYFLNHYGFDFINRIMELPLTCNGDHYVIKI